MCSASPAQRRTRSPREARRARACATMNENERRIVLPGGGILLESPILTVSADFAHHLGQSVVFGEQGTAVAVAAERFAGKEARGAYRGKHT